MRIVSRARGNLVTVSLAYWATALLTAVIALYARQLAQFAHGLSQTRGATDWRAAENVLIAFGGLYVALWIIALAALWVRRTEHEPG